MYFHIIVHDFMIKIVSYIAKFNLIFNKIQRDFLQLCIAFIRFIL